MRRRLVFCALLAGCTCESEDKPLEPPPSVSAPPSISAPPVPLAPLAPALPVRRCASEMVDVGGAFCIDRYEVSLVDNERGRALSPFYPPTRERTQKLFDVWQQQRATMGPPWARELALPEPPAWQRREEFEPRAVVLEGTLPSGYLSGKLAALACKNAGKRLCSEAEWSRACRGERDLPFPYGAEYQAGACNVARSSHPAAILHDNASIGHFDPRLNLTSDADGPLLRPTGALPLCASDWGDDAIYDMVGNLDEWIDDPSGVSSQLDAFAEATTDELAGGLSVVDPCTRWLIPSPDG